MAYSFPRPQLVKILCKDVWNPQPGQRTLADLTREDSAAVWAAINLKLTTALFNAKIFFKNDMVMVWEPKYAPAVEDILKFSKDFKDAVMFMMFRIGSMQSLMDGPNHPCLDQLKGYDETLNEFTSTPSSSSNSIWIPSMSMSKGMKTTLSTSSSPGPRLQ